MLNNTTSTITPPPPVPHASAAPDLEPPKKKRGPKSPLTDDQIDIIQTYFPAMEKLLVQHELHAGKEDKVPDPDAVVTWFDNTITKILKTKAFETLDKTKKTPAQWRVNQKTFALHYLQSKNNETRSPDEFIKAADALVSFKVPAAPKKLFERENKEAIIALMNKKIADLTAKTPGGEYAENDATESPETRADNTRNPNPAALYQNALTELWAKADKQRYIDEASSVDIFKNQAMFQESMYNTLCALAEGGAIGPSEMLLWVGFCDKDNVVQCQRLHAHHRYDPDNTIKPFIEGDEATEIENTWESFCERTIPCHPKKSPSNGAIDEGASTIDVPRTAAGVLVLPEIDFDNTTRIQLLETLINFRKALWYFSYPADINMPSVPVAHIAAHPEDYLDVEQFPQAVELATVESLDLVALFELAKYLGSVSHTTHSTPITFRPKAEIQRRAHDRSVKEERERQTGDEIVYVTQTASGNAPAPSKELQPSPASAAEQQVDSLTSVGLPSNDTMPVKSSSTESLATANPLLVSASRHSTPFEPLSTDSLATTNPLLISASPRSTSVDAPPMTSVDAAVPPPVNPHSPSVAVETACAPSSEAETSGPPLTSLDTSGASTDTPPTAMSDHSKKRKRPNDSESQENILPAPKTRRRAGTSGGVDQGTGAGRVTRASTKQAAEPRTLQGGRRGNVAGGHVPGDQVEKRKGRR
ncbi:hypothetical protein C8R42DRAFT_643852 [Lentinula raphanica]|nr:hypothetical protein C8R42DRAFT_643852 [Lentinula raphanica]